MRVQKVMTPRIVESHATAFTHPALPAPITSRHALPFRTVASRFRSRLRVFDTTEEHPRHLHQAFEPTMGVPSRPLSQMPLHDLEHDLRIELPCDPHSFAPTHGRPIEPCISRIPQAELARVEPHPLLPRSSPPVRHIDHIRIGVRTGPPIPFEPTSRLHSPESRAHGEVNLPAGLGHERIRGHHRVIPDVDQHRPTAVNQKAALVETSLQRLARVDVLVFRRIPRQQVEGPRPQTQATEDVRELCDSPRALRPPGSSRTVPHHATAPPVDTKPPGGGTPRGATAAGPPRRPGRESVATTRGPSQ